MLLKNYQYFLAIVEAGGVSKAAEKLFISQTSVSKYLKRLEDNLELLRRLKRLAEICGKDYPLLVGLSRKSFIGEITGRDAEDRLPGTLAANASAIMRGANIIRVHDVKEHRDLARTLFALLAEQ